ncbi:MAG: FAD-dependent oxidoreductase [PVC group bacterium]
MKTRTIDVAIVGAGTAGMYALSRAIRGGGEVVIFEGGELGTTCARVGCMPSKMLVHSGENDAAAGFAFQGSGRAILDDVPGGILRIYADGATGRILGAEMAAPAGEHLAHLIAALIQAEMTVEEALELPFYHPTYEEGVRDCLRILRGKLR